jgi:hypothetical protein
MRQRSQRTFRSPDNDTIGRPSITLATLNTLRVVELPAATQTGSLRFDFSFPTHAAERYEVIFKRHSLVNSVDTWTTIGNYERVFTLRMDSTSKEYTNLKQGFTLSPFEGNPVARATRWSANGSA